MSQETSLPLMPHFLEAGCNLLYVNSYIKQDKQIGGLPYPPPFVENQLKGDKTQNSGNMATT